MLVRYPPVGRGLVAWQAAAGAPVGVGVASFNSTGTRGSVHLLPAPPGMTAVVDDLEANGHLAAVGWHVVGADGEPGPVQAATWRAGGTIGSPEGERQKPV